MGVPVRGGRAGHRTGASAALVAPNVDTGTFNQFLRILSAEVGPGEHAVLILDRAGWHQSRAP